jgi:hypothetical protein
MLCVGLKTQAKSTPIGRKRLASESSEMSESSNSAPPVRLEEVAGVEPEVQRTPRKIDGVKGEKHVYTSNYCHLTYLLPHRKKVSCSVQARSKH